MSVDPETTRIVRSWLDEGVTQLPDPVLDAVLDQVPATPQRRATRWPVRRYMSMNSMLKFGLAAAAVAVIAIVGYQLLPGSGRGLGGPSGTPVPTVTPQPSPTEIPQPTPTPIGLLPEGPHVLNDGEPLEGTPTLRTTVTIPAPDWYGQAGDGILIKNDNSAAPDGAGMITFFGDLYVYGDPCEWATTRPDEPATTVDELVSALAAQASRAASEPVDVTVGGYAGKGITLHVPDDAVFSECDQGLFGSWGVPGDDLTPFRYHQDPGQIDEVWIVDVNGELAIIDLAYYEGTPQVNVDEMRAIIDSVTFEAP